MKRVYIVPLKSSVVKTPNYKRAKKAISTLRQFMLKHMKADEVKVGRFLNEKIWERGIKRPPSKVKVEAIKEVKDQKSIVSVELVDLSKKALKILDEEKKEKALSEKKKKSVKKTVDKGEGLSDLINKSDSSSDAKKNENSGISTNDRVSEVNEEKKPVSSDSIIEKVPSEDKSKSD